MDIEARLEVFAGKGIHLDLAPIRDLLERRGNPQRTYPSVIVGGTNGKGSVCSALACILRQAGYKVGLYTSPHLVDVRERIRVNENLISSAEFMRILDELIEAGGDKLTYFEILTALAFQYFKDSKVDIAVLEVGMGGRLDATNVADPLVSVITNISRDHCEFLGNRLIEIAREKAGIIREDGICLTGVRHKTVRDEIERIAKARGARLYMLGRDFRVRRRDREVGFDYYGLYGNFRFLSFGLSGPHQIKNAALAVGAGEILSRLGFTITEEHLRRGLEHVKWEGRLERVADRPVTLLDGAHNTAGIGALCRALKENYPGKRFIFVFGCLADKDYKSMLARLRSLADLIILTHPPTARGRPTSDLIPAVHGDFEVVEDPVSAYEKARTLAQKDDIVCVTGSLYLVGAIKAYLRKFGME
ncbi:MAG TPA: folylpolyglutamate synthase/dihydrofolate synthase family protein [Syntrophales bacterium]|nr:folylpolyglutamate synthase/dihydrofolate synthase family protein [Syntrophales bacterium]